MILIDTSVWIDHLHTSQPGVIAALGGFEVAQHPLVIGELALGTLRDRPTILGLLKSLPQAPVATHDEVLHFAERHELFGRGLSLVDAHLLASVTLGPGLRIWTRDRRLHAVAEERGFVHSE